MSHRHPAQRYSSCAVIYFSIPDEVRQFIHFTPMTSRRTQGKHDEARPLLRRALGISERTLGPDHPRVAQSLKSLAILLSAEVLCVAGAVISG